MDVHFGLVPVVAALLVDSLGSDSSSDKKGSAVFVSSLTSMVSSAHFKDQVLASLSYFAGTGNFRSRSFIQLSGTSLA